MTWTRVTIELDVYGAVDNSYEPAAGWADAVMADDRIFAASIHFGTKHKDECTGETCGGCGAAVYREDDLHDRECSR